jgi:PEP-CTERM motif
MKAQAERSPGVRLREVIAFMIGVVWLLTQLASINAAHIPNSLDMAGLRTPLPGEGYLAYSLNPVSGRFGDEWTGWIDVRHPSLAGPRDTDFGYDRSDRFVQVRSTILTDNTGATAANNRVVDFDFANKAYVYQAGVSVLETSTRGVVSPPVGAAGTFSFPLTFPQEQSIMAANNGAAPTIELYYANGLNSGANGETYYPSLIAGAGNEAIFKGSSAFQSTFPHELYHFVGDGQAVHQPLAGDPTHSSDQANIVRTSGVAVNSIGEVGPVLSPTVGGKLQITTPQVERMFSAGGTAPFFPDGQRGDRDAYGDRVDWDFVTDHSSFQNDGKQFGLEGVGSGVDNHVGIDSLFWTIGITVPVFQNPPDANNGGHDHTGLGVFPITPDFAGPFFNTVDVFSLSTRYSDSDINPASGNLSLREGALDYDLFFRGVDGSLVPGIPLLDFIGGWSPNTFVDDFLARWRSPINAVGVFIFADSGNGHDRTAQIDAVIAAFVPTPEPSTLLLLAVGLLALAAVKRKSSFKKM